MCMCEARLVRIIVLFAVALAGLAGETRAGWQENFHGIPPVTHYSLEAMGSLELATSIIEDRRGRILVGGDGLCVFDGLVWARHPFGSGYQMINALGRTRDGRILCGGLNELGYYKETPGGGFAYRSLLAALPPGQEEISTVWACAEIGAELVYFCRSRILAWDGTRFRVWDFPTATRLFPVEVGGEWWFTHAETGLYRLTPQGPERRHAPEELPARAPMWLERDGPDLLVASSNGLFRVGRPGEPLWSPAAMAYLETAGLTGVLRLPEGGFLASTLNGIGVISPSGELLQVLDQNAGLPLQLCNRIYLDRSDQVWIAGGRQGVMRFDRRGAERVFTELAAGRGQMPAVYDIAAGEREVALASERGVFRLRRDAPVGRFVLQPEAGAQAYYSVALLGDDLLVGSYGMAEFIRGSDRRTVFSQLSTSVYQILPMRPAPGRVYLRHNGTVVVAEQAADGNWTHAPLLNPAEYASQVAVDARGDLWVATARDGLQHHAIATGLSTTVQKPSGDPRDSRYTTVTAAGDKVYALIGADLFAASAGRPAEVRRVARLPIEQGVRIAADAVGTRLHVLFVRYSPAGSRVFGLGVVELEPAGGTGRWLEYQVSGLGSIGSPTTLGADPVDGALWIAGTRGVLRLDGGSLPVSGTPRSPELTLSASGVEVAPGGMPRFPFRDHALKVEAFTPEIARRADLWFQSRLGGERHAWSAPTQVPAFLFNRLSEGDYLLEVRTVDSGGRTSLPATLGFRILPPWWRSPVAYVCYAAGLAAGGFVLLRVRERRNRVRTAKLEHLVAVRTAELREANAAKDEFLSNISHEIRNPLNGIVGLAAAIDPDRLDGATRERFGHLRHCADHLSSMLEDLLDFSKLEAGAVALKDERFHLPDLVASVVSLTAATSAEAGLPLDVAVSPTVPTWVRGDPGRIRQIVLNFVINAFRYAGRGEVLLTVWARPRRTGEVEVTFAVSDDGPGIAPQEQAQLFTRFMRGAAARTRRVGGSGIGLAVSKALADRMGGRLWVESEAGHGTTFHFSVTLPLTEAPSAAAGAALPPAARWRALLVDDEAYNLVALAALLEPLGFTVVTAASGREALQAARRLPPPEVVFLDHALPDLPGPQVARELRGLPGFGAPLPIFATTAYVTPDKHAECLAAGMTAVLTKPLTAPKLFAALAGAGPQWRSAPPADFPPSAPADPLAALRLLARRKQSSLARELELFWAELQAEAAEVGAALGARDAARASRAAHKLTGRFAFVQAAGEEELLRRTERLALGGDWPGAERAWAEVGAGLERLRERLSAGTD